MKKLSLNASVLQKGEMLTREQMKTVLGGVGSTHRCYTSSEDRVCSFAGPNGNNVDGECADVNGQCRCVAFDNTASVPSTACVKP